MGAAAYIGRAKFRAPSWSEVMVPEIITRWEARCQPVKPRSCQEAR
jgi:hypothetical protein